MDEHEELVRSLVTERFSRWRPPSANGVQMGYTEHASADMDSPSTSVTAEISAQIRNDETRTTEMSDR
jgi:hypothetical protein